MRRILLGVLLGMALMAQPVMALRIASPPIFTEWNVNTFTQLNTYLHEVWNVLNGRYDEVTGNVTANALNIRLGDTLVDANGTTTTGPGTAATRVEEDLLVAVESGDKLCTNSLTLPTSVRIDGNSNCSTSGGTDTVILIDATGTVAVTNAWAFVDDDGDKVFDAGEDLYIDSTPKESSTGGLSEWGRRVRSEWSISRPPERMRLRSG